MGNVNYLNRRIDVPCAAAWQHILCLDSSSDDDFEPGLCCRLQRTFFLSVCDV